MTGELKSGRVLQKTWPDTQEAGVAQTGPRISFMHERVVEDRSQRKLGKPSAFPVD